MTPTQIVLLVLLVIVVEAIAVVVVVSVRRAALRRRFGPEYDRVVGERDSRVAAERELTHRQWRHHGLQLNTIAPAARERFIQRWRGVQTQFVDDPIAAVVAGDELVTELVRDRGYPTEDYDEQLSLLSVEHARTLGSYRDAHEICLKARRGEASTEDLRQALVHYRDLFADILGAQPAANDDRPEAAPVRRPATGRGSDWASDRQRSVTEARNR
jgi:hypothetical protein